MKSEFYFIQRERGGGMKIKYLGKKNYLSLFKNK